MAPHMFDRLKNDLDKLEIDELRKKIIRLSLAYQMTQDLGPIRELEKLVEMLIDRVTSALRVEIGSLMLVDKLQKELRIRAARGLEKEIIKQTRVKFGEGIAGWVAKEAKPLLIDDLNKYPHFERRGKRYHTDSLLTVPLVVGGEIVGVLNVNNKLTKEIFNKDDLETLITIANQAALLIKNSQEYEEMKKLSQVKSDFVSIVSHELRTPLTTVKESLGLLLDEIPGKITQRQEEILSIAKQNIDRLNRLITDLLDISKMEAGKMQMRREFVDVIELIKEGIKSFEQSAKKKGVFLKAHIKDNIKGIWADSDRIAEVLNNLIGNATKYTLKGGKIDVTLRKKDKGIEIIVEDTGKGIERKSIDKVFDKFSQLSFEDGKIVSTGLGLAITKDIVDLHRGNIFVESEIGKGSKFTVDLPMDLREKRI